LVVTVGLERIVELALRHQHLADLVISNRQVSLIGHIVGPLGSKPRKQTIGFVRAGKLLAGVSKDFVIARELDQHPSLTVAQFRRRPAVSCHVVEQTLGLGEKTKRRGARHVVLLRLRNGLVDDLGRALERGIEECLVGLELLPGIDRAAARCDREHEKHTRERCPDSVATPARPFRPPHDLVKAEAEEPGHHLLLGDLLAVALLSCVGRNRFLALVGDLSIRSELAPQRGRETFARGIARLAIDDQRDHALAAAQHLEAAHLLVDVLALRRVRRANDDQKLRGFKCGNGLLGERVPCRKVFAIPEDRPQCLRHRPCRRIAPGEVLVDAIAFERCVQPLAPRLVAVAVAQEGTIFEWDELAHRTPAKNICWTIYVQN
jgi:hypothetical protein